MPIENSIVYAYFSFFIHHLMDIGGFYILTIVYSPTIGISVRFFSTLVLSPLITHLLALKLNHREVLFLGLLYTVSIISALVYIPTNSAEEFPSFCSSSILLATFIFGNRQYPNLYKSMQLISENRQHLVVEGELGSGLKKCIRFTYSHKTYQVPI